MFSHSKKPTRSFSWTAGKIANDFDFSKAGQKLSKIPHGGVVVEVVVVVDGSAVVTSGNPVETTANTWGGGGGHQPQGGKGGGALYNHAFLWFTRHGSHERCSGYILLTNHPYCTHYTVWVHSVQFCSIISKSAYACVNIKQH